MEIKPFRCEDCGANFRRNAHLILHAETHRLICKFCEREFSKIRKLERHINKRHFSETAYVCQTCGKILASKKGLKEHLKLLHIKEKAHLCALCDEKFVSRYKLNYHISKMHSKDRHVCQFCDKKFIRKSSLKSMYKSILVRNRMFAKNVE